jgi:hypothetical protein
VAREDEWFIYIKDYDQKHFAFAGPISGSQVDDWIDAVVQEQEKGRELFCQEVKRAKLSECQAHAKGKGFSETEFEKLVDAPRDRSKDYRGKLPNYASKADRAKVVQLLCKGKCGAVRWAEMNMPFPGKEVLRNATLGEYQATCLRCGSTARDNYNWYR